MQATRTFDDSPRSGHGRSALFWLWRIARLRFGASAFVLAASAAGAATLLDLPIADPAALEAIEHCTVARQLKTVRFAGTLQTVDWLMDRPVLSATLARHLHPPLERYHVTDRGKGVYAVDDEGAVRGSVRLATRAPGRRVYIAGGEFRSLANLLQFSGTMVFAVAYRELRDGGETYVEIEPQLFLRIDNGLIHGIRGMLAPVLNGIIDRRVTGLTEAARIVSGRLVKDPAALYREMQTWPDVRPDELAEFQRAYGIASGVARQAE
jgi:hypothetical protein